MDREYAFRTLQVQHTFSIREYTHKEKVFESPTQANKFACSPQKEKARHDVELFLFAEAGGFELPDRVNGLLFSRQVPSTTQPHLRINTILFIYTFLLNIAFMSDIFLFATLNK